MAMLRLFKSPSRRAGALEYSSEECEQCNSSVCMYVCVMRHLRSVAAFRLSVRLVLDVVVRTCVCVCGVRYVCAPTAFTKVVTADSGPIPGHLLLAGIG